MMLISEFVRNCLYMIYAAPFEEKIKQKPEK